MKEKIEQRNIQQAVTALKAGEVIAYPTESCFGLGCDPQNQSALEKIIQLKARSVNKGLILIASSIEQTKTYVTFENLALEQQILNSWPGPNTWLLPPKQNVNEILRGEFSLLAIRVTAHPIAKQLCESFGGAIVSTSANLAGESALLETKSVAHVFGKQLHIVEGLIGEDTKPSTIRDGLTGQILRQ